jgi:hypothetical protein
MITADTSTWVACLDADLPLITRDRDFRSFAEASSLHLLLYP